MRSSERACYTESAATPGRVERRNQSTIGKKRHMDDSTELFRRLAGVVIRLGYLAHLKPFEETYYSLTEAGLLPRSYSDKEAQAFQVFIEHAFGSTPAWAPWLSLERDAHAGTLMSAWKYAQTASPGPEAPLAPYPILELMLSANLTIEEVRVAALSALGYGVTESAKLLQKDKSTIKSQRLSIQSKLNLTSTEQEYLRSELQKLGFGELPDKVTKIIQGG